MSFRSGLHFLLISSFIHTHTVSNGTTSTQPMFSFSPTLRAGLPAQNRSSLILRHLSSSRPSSATSSTNSASTANTSNLKMSLPEKMKAIIIPKHGDVDVIELAEVPAPVQNPGEVLIKASTTSSYSRAYNQTVRPVGQLCRCELYRHLHAQGPLPSAVLPVPNRSRVIGHGRTPTERRVCPC